jgi:hypothetical protein
MDIKYVIGLSGVARAGKDLFCDMLLHSLNTRGYKAERFALADRLKSDINPFLIEHTGVNLFRCEPEDKEVVRPLLVEYGAVKRKQSEGKWWTSQLELEIRNSHCNVAVVTDIRYDRYPEDELFWIKEKLGGMFVHISRYNIVNGREEFVQPANKEEMCEDPKMAAAADYRIEWETCGDEGRQIYIDKFLTFVIPVIDIKLGE